MLEGDHKGTAAAIRERCAHQLGNLTLSGYNSKLGTMEFLKSGIARTIKETSSVTATACT